MSFDYPSILVSAIAAMVSYAFLLFLLSKPKKTRVARLFQVIVAVNAVWMTMSALAPQAIFAREINTLLWRVDFVVAMLVPIANYIFVIAFAKKESKRSSMLALAVMYVVVSVVGLMSNYMIAGVKLLPSGFVDYQKGQYFWLFAVMIAIPTFTSYLIAMNTLLSAKKKSVLRKQWSGVVIAMSLPVVTGLVTNLILPTLGVEFPRLANLSIIPFVGLMAISIYKYKTFSIVNSLSIRGKILVGFFVTLMIPVVMMVGVGYRAASEGMRELSMKNGEVDVDRHIEELRSTLDDYHREILVLGRSPAIEGIIRAIDNNGVDLVDSSTYEQWEERLQAIFLNQETITSEYMQLRYIDEAGQERVRVDYDDEKANVVSDDELQNKADRYYFLEGMQLAEGEVYVSPLDLNREGSPSEIVIPYQPTIRYATPVFDESGQRRGIVIANILADKLLTNLHDDVHPISVDEKLYLINEAGYFLVNPNSDKEWGRERDLATGYGVESEFPVQEKLLKNEKKGSWEDSEFIYIFQKIVVESDQVGGEEWILIKQVDKSQILALLIKFRNLAIRVSGVVIILVTIWGWAFSLVISEPIRKLKESVEKVTKDKDWNVEIGVNSSDEVGELAKSFAQMVKTVQKSREEVDKKVVKQTKEIVQGAKELEDQRLAILNILEDIAEEKESITIQAQELRKFRAAVEASSELIAFTDADGIVLWGNEAVKKITGYSAKEALGKKAGALWGHLMEKSWYDKLWKTIKKDKKVFVGEVTNHKKSGEKYTALLMIYPLLDTKGNVEFFVATQRDITREKEVDRMKTDFISLASHQLRTPLSAMKWFLEMLNAGDLGKLSKEQKEAVENIEQSNERMIALVNSLLNISRIESGRIIVEPEPTCLQEIVESTGKELAEKFDAKKQALIISANKEIPKIKLDPKLIRQVVINLLTNANKYTPEKGEITVFVSRKGKEVVVQVSDTGYGIPSAEQHKLFDRFFRATNVVKQETDGTGLGLYLAKAIVESSGGKLWFKSEEGKGTTFWFSIPLAGVKAKKGQVRLS